MPSKPCPCCGVEVEAVSGNLDQCLHTYIPALVYECRCGYWKRVDPNPADKRPRSKFTTGLIGSSDPEEPKV